MLPNRTLAALLVVSLLPPTETAPWMKFLVSPQALREELLPRYGWHFVPQHTHLPHALQ
ncbi:hypothetical protein OIN59_10925 [Acidovorax sp. D2M1]|uniref:Uncharacterized protein n=1 Tax=Acidovorax benzenivorans TaxID=2987520 RepID=A0ABT5RW70_9BURK|nr:hypothetical protein [Acidovorax benzenivorans]MDD2177947.1 hypothetical protein [Acidovorax benzenivorans]